jgi:receptor protein-tyrosine kinase
MNAEVPFLNPDDNVLRAVLISNCGLSTEQVAQIEQTARELNFDFARAAMQRGFVTEKECSEAQVYARRFGDQDRSQVGPIEAAVRRLATTQRRPGFSTSAIVCKVSPDLVLLREPYNAHSEKLRALRTELLMLSQADVQPCVMAVASAYAGEGRSQLAAELAISFAQLGRNTLLVDADMRHPHQQFLFAGADGVDGLAQALIATRAPQVHSVEGLPNLFVLPTGPTPPNPLELLSAHYFRRLVDEWRSAFDFVVFDTPPISMCSDGLAVATVAERTLLLSRAKHTSYRGFKDMLRRMAIAETQILGGVINHF